MGVFERIPGILIAATFPLVYVIIAVGIIEAVLVLAHHPIGYRGICPLRSGHVLRGRSLPTTGESSTGRVGRLQYLVDGRGHLLFAGRPRLFGRSYLLRVAGFDLGGAIRIDVSAPLSLTLTFIGICALFLGLAGAALLADGLTSATIYLLLGGVFIGVWWWYVRAEVKRAPAYLEEVLDHMAAPAEDEGAT
jgi:hypothetical protein